MIEKYNKFILNMFEDIDYEEEIDDDFDDNYIAWKKDKKGTVRDFLKQLGNSEINNILNNINAMGYNAKNEAFDRIIDILDFEIIFDTRNLNSITDDLSILLLSYYADDDYYADEDIIDSFCKDCNSKSEFIYSGDGYKCNSCGTYLNDQEM